LEANYDEIKLLNGAYPYYLKKRIRSPLGHLSNDECAATAATLAAGGAGRMVLMHLSKENNAPELAATACLAALENAGVAMDVRVAPRFEMGEPLEV
jgi:phosphoribosyl 1,2-cyclic phosphodiesterase